MPEIFGYDISWSQVAIGSALVLVPAPLAYLAYSGLFSKAPRASCRRPPYGKMRVAYKFLTGPYWKCGKYFKELEKIESCRTCLGIYYDDPDKVPAEKLCYVVGAILAEGDDSVDAEIVRKYEDKGYKMITLPEVAAAVQAKMAATTYLSYMLAPKKAYPAMDKYIQEHKLRWNPALEIYDGESIQFMIPQSDGEKFCVPEVPFDSLKLS